MGLIEIKCFTRFRLQGILIPIIANKDIMIALSPHFDDSEILRFWKNLNPPLEAMIEEVAVLE